jgi:anti-sigma regulatory factor (Ser/Thr protein kinase)
MASVQTRSVADKASLSDLRRSLRHDLAAAGVAEATTFDCLIAVTEACNRATANSSSADPGASITWDTTPTEARFCIEGACSRDACRAFHPSRTDHLDLTDTASSDDMSLALINGLMDRVEVVSGARGRIVSLTKLL